MQLFIRVAFSIFASRGCKASCAPQISDGRLRWLLFCKAELRFSSLVLEREGAMVKPPPKTHLSPVPLDLPQSRIYPRQHLRTMDVKLMTLAAALVVVLYAPPSQGMQLYPWFISFFFQICCCFFCLLVCLFLGYNGTKMLARLSETVGNQFEIFYLSLGYKTWPSGYN